MIKTFLFVRLGKEVVC